MSTGGWMPQAGANEAGSGTASSIGPVEILTALQNIVKALNASTALTTRSVLEPTASAYGLPVKITATASPGTLFHTAGRNVLDQVWLFLSNTANAPRQVTLQLGDVLADHQVSFTVPGHETLRVLDGAILGHGLALRAFASVANDIRMFGWVVRR